MSYDGPAHFQQCLLPMASVGPIHSPKAAANAVDRPTTFAAAAPAIASLGPVHF